jgi:hypothetical protein
MYPDPPDQASDSKNAITSVAEAASKMIADNPSHFPGAGDAR